MVQSISLTKITGGRSEEPIDRPERAIQRRETTPQHPETIVGQF